MTYEEKNAAEHAANLETQATPQAMKLVCWHRTLIRCPKPNLNGSTKKITGIPSKTASKCTTMDARLAQNGCGTCVAWTAFQWKTFHLTI